MCRSLLLTEDLRQALLTVKRCLEIKKGAWLIGGSCGLLLQGVKLNRAPRDLDIYADENGIAELYAILQPFAVDRPHNSDTGMYRSCLSHYTIHGVQAELVGSLKVETEGTRYLTELADVLVPNHAEAELQGETFPLMPLAHELLFNVLRKRADRYETIALTMRQHLSRHMPLIRLLLSRYPIHPRIVEQIQSLLQCKLEGRQERHAAGSDIYAGSENG